MLEIMLTVAVVILIFLGDFASALIPIVTAPLTILIVLAIFRPLGISLNILSIGGLALAVGTLVDASIVVVEQVHKKLELRAGRGAHKAVRAALDEVCGPAFFALLVTGVAFLPILALDGQEGRLFAPLAWAKTDRHPGGGDSGGDARSGIAAVACGLVAFNSAARIQSSPECRADPGIYSRGRVRVAA